MEPHSDILGIFTASVLTVRCPTFGRLFTKDPELTDEAFLFVNGAFRSGYRTKPRVFEAGCGKYIVVLRWQEEIGYVLNVIGSQIRIILL